MAEGMLTARVGARLPAAVGHAAPPALSALTFVAPGACPQKPREGGSRAGLSLVCPTFSAQP